MKLNSYMCNVLCCIIITTCIWLKTKLRLLCNYFDYRESWTVGPRGPTIYLYIFIYLFCILNGSSGIVDSKFYIFADILLLGVSI